MSTPDKIYLTREEAKLHREKKELTSLEYTISNPVEIEGDAEKLVDELIRLSRKEILESPEDEGLSFDMIEHKIGTLKTMLLARLASQAKVGELVEVAKWAK